MRYLLTKKEYDALKRLGYKAHADLKKTLQDLCTQVADLKPVVWGWGGPDPKPWGCIITKAKEGEAKGEDGEWYCDQCPVQKVCPYECKEWSK